MGIKLREGGIYLTREGKKVGPLHRHDHPVYIWADGIYHWTESGSILDGWDSHGLDLVSEVIESTSPVRKVMRTEIVPGTYGDINVVEGVLDSVRIKGDYINLTFDNISRLRAVASIFTELADALDAMAKESNAVREAGVM